MERAVLLMNTLNVSQKANNEFSHKGDKALDLSGKDSGIDNLKAPFTGIIKRIYTSSNAVWLESLNRVKYADGTTDYMTVLTMHDNDVSNLKVGDVIKQGSVYFEEGRKGYTTGNHIHLAVGKGKFTGNGWYENSYGNWVINNQYDVHKGLFLDSNTIVKNDGGYNWIKTDSLVEEEIKIENTYIVQRGDNLTKIAKKYNTTVNELVRLNKITNKNLIYVGQVLKLPSDAIYFDKYIGSSSSLVDSLKSLGEKSDYTYRTKIALVNEITNYKGTKTQNIYLLNKLKEGILIKP